MRSLVSRPADREQRTRSLLRARSVRFRRLRVEVVGGPDHGHACTSREDNPEVSVGTARGNDLVLGDPAVSRHHLVIRAGRGGSPGSAGRGAEGPLIDGFHLRDLGSTNGTFLSGCRIESAWIAPGTVVRLGETSVQLTPLDEEGELPLSDAERFGRVLGRSAGMRRLFEVIARVARTETTVLIEGETGTGKELIAEAIHRASARRFGPFQVVDCGAIPRTLIESELFGHEKGAFTGATEARVGAFEAAEGGTIFLDEVGELPLDMQPKLLRALESRTIRRVGGENPVRLDVRVLAATHRDLRREVNRGAFRSDLYYRLNVVHLPVPPLRDRPEDIPLLAAAFWEELAADPEMPPELLEAFAAQEWRGNVRELRNAVERAALMGEPALLSAFVEDLRATPPAGPSVAPEIYDARLSFRAAKERGVARWEREYVAELIRRHEGNVSAASRAARMDRNHLSDLLTRHGVTAKPTG